MTGTVSALFGRVALVMVLAVNILAASYCFVHQRREIGAAGALLEDTGGARRAPVLATAVSLAVSSGDAAKFASFACLRDLLIVEHSIALENALLRMSLPAYPMPYPSPGGDYASVFLSNQEFIENARAGRIAAIAPEVLTREIAGSRALLLESLRNDAGSVVLRNLAEVLENNSDHRGSDAFRQDAAAPSRNANRDLENVGAPWVRRAGRS